MNWCSKRRLLAAAAAAVVVAAAAEPAAAQGVREVDIHVLGVLSRPLFGGAGVGYAWRDARRTRVLGALAVGAIDGGGVAGRADLAWNFLLDPAKRAGSAVYGGGGLTVQAGAGRVTPYLLLVVGVENHPGGRGGSYVELGVGGGVRAAVGYRWRKRGAPGR